MVHLASLFKKTTPADSKFSSNQLFPERWNSYSARSAYKKRRNSYSARNSYSGSGIPPFRRSAFCLYPPNSTRKQNFHLLFGSSQLFKVQF